MKLLNISTIHVIASICIFISSSLSSIAQEIKQTKAYKYSKVTNCDANENPVETLKASGIIVFSEAQGMEFFSLALGDSEVPYNGQIINKKTETMSSSKSVNIYLIKQEFHSKSVPIQVFEFFDHSKSSFVADAFVVKILNANTFQTVATQLYEGITRVR
ncbi:MAG: hypothetical protein Q4E41_00140 [Bacteroidales bacterium]|nr:hypothetical protein [Bacteroidales bacterium]